MDLAQEALDYIRKTTAQTSGNDAKEATVNLLSAFDSIPPPNTRTYNIYLKGLANAGRLDEAVRLSQDMRADGLWDPVTTNTLVHAAVVAGDLDLAKDLLSKYTYTPSRRNNNHKDHPNVEAYTEVLDAYAKASQLPNALALFQVMRERGVQPNEITFT